MRSVNQLHALLRDLVAGGAPTALKAHHAAAMLRKIRPANPVQRTRKQLAWDLVREIRSLDTALESIAERMIDALEARPTRLVDIDGVGPVLAARLIGRCGRASRFATADAFASYAGTAPVEASSGETVRRRLSRSGDRKLNSALHLVAVTQVRMPNSEGRRYYDRKISHGKTHKEAMRCLKRKIAGRVWRVMLADEQHRDRPDTASHQAA